MVSWVRIGDWELVMTVASGYLLEKWWNFLLFRILHMLNNF